MRRLPSLVDTLRWRAEHEAERVSLSFLSVDAAPVRWTYAELDERARAIAATLQRGSVERALLLYPQGLDFVAAIVGCFYAGTVAIPLPVPRPNGSGRRVECILAEAIPDAILCDESVASLQGPLAATAPRSAGVKWIQTDALSMQLAEEWHDFAPDPKDLAFLQYTSGSTADPRGVRIGHANLIANSHFIARRFEHTRDSHILSWLPHFHDMGLIGCILHPLHRGMPCTLMDPLQTVQQPLRWLRAISDERATTSGAPNFAYEACTRRISEEDRAELDLSCWNVAFNGAEPVSALTLERFNEFFAACGFRPEAFFPCYGLAEATLFVAGGPKSDKPRIRQPLEASHRLGQAPERLVGCGQIAHSTPDTLVAIVDPASGERATADDVGEVWIAGPSIPAGYQPCQSSQPSQPSQPSPNEGVSSFGNLLAGSSEHWFRTGDLGFVEDGELYITGRIKDIVIVSGTNYAAEDIERSIEDAHSWLAPGRCAAFAIRLDGYERLAVAVEVARDHWQHIEEARQTARRSLWQRLKRGDVSAAQATPAKEREIREAIRGAISREHGINAGFIAVLSPSSLPRTTSGKVQRHACRAEYEAARLRETGMDPLPPADAGPLPNAPPPIETGTRH